MVTESVWHKLATLAEGEGRSVYLVGGCLRDEMLRRDGLAGVEHRADRLNIDLAIERGAIDAAQRWARELRGAFVLLHESFGSARIVLDNGTEVDVTDFRGATIEDDLRGRDFTVNALALPIAHATVERWSERDLIDPLGGVQDVRQGRLRLCSPTALRDDAVRIVRGIALAARYGFALDDEAITAIRASAPLLRHVAMERVMEPCWTLMAQANAAPWVAKMEAWGVLDAVLPELTAGRGVDQGGYHHLAVLPHQIEALRQLELLLNDAAVFGDRHREELLAYLQEPLSEWHPRVSVMKWSVLLHDIGKPSSRSVDEAGRVWFIGHEVVGAQMAESLAERLRFARREQAALVTMVRQHLRPGQLARLRRNSVVAGTGGTAELQPTPRAIFRFFRDAGAEGMATLIVWLADRQATMGPDADPETLPGDAAMIAELLGRYFDKMAEAVGPPRLVDGRQLMAHLGVGPGPLIGRLLRELAEAQVEGEVHTEDEALQLAGRLRQKWGDGGNPDCGMQNAE